LTGTGPDGPVSVSVPIVNGQSFADWIASYYPAAGNNQNTVGPNATPLGDGVSNIIKYAFGIDPKQPLTNADRARFASVNRVISAGASNRMELNFTLNPAATDIAFGFEVAPSMSGPWVEVVSEDLVVTEISTVNGREVKVLLPAVSGEQQYYRVKLGYDGD
jgi:hypothetical protein